MNSRMKVYHPCKGMTNSQIEVFEQIAIGNALPPAHKKTIAKLEAKGLIVRIDDKELGRDRFGSIAVPQYIVPIPIHMQWCEWCSQHINEGEGDHEF